MKQPWNFLNILRLNYLNILRKEALVLMNYADFGKRISVRRKLSRAAMDNDALDYILALQ